ncbi:hypothetical protein [Pseudomonas sp. AB12(2023)]|uniref:hypothetical protein n=1 Tax=Pseudomonas sp. AB12(2023) TaxID=3048597 RepID=UPI002B22CCF3|nr:hypothetical protein [Pseudomonas sp. AB12(2023)]
MNFKELSILSGKKTLWTVWNVILPFASFKRTVVLAKREVERNKENLEYLRYLNAEAKRTLFGEDTSTAEQTAKSIQSNDVFSKENERSFSEVIASRSPDSPSIEALHRSFLFKKRWAVFVGLGFTIFGLFGIGESLAHSNYKGLMLALISILVTLPMFYVAALGAQLRIWQIRTGRLSKAERGDLYHFIEDFPNWWLQVLSLEIDVAGVVARTFRRSKGDRS